VSTQKQGASGLGLEAQQFAVEQYLANQGGNVVATFKETESGKNNDRPRLADALKRCRQTRASLLVAKLDCLSRNAAFLLSLRDSGVRFVAADLPDMNELRRSAESAQVCSARAGQERLQDCAQDLS
jgi:DNA invertase Pin-like site-specific DNA recombinase